MDWNNINEDRDTSGLGPIEYDQSKVPALIRKHADNVRGKSYGQQVREAQARNAEYAGLIASESMSIASNADLLSKDTQNRFKDQIEGNTDVDEVIDARRPYGGVAFKTLSDRLNAQIKYVNYDMFSEDGLTDVEIIKATHEYANANNVPVINVSGEYDLDTPLDIPIQTDVNWGDTVFRVNEENYTKDTPYFRIFEKENEIKLTPDLYDSVKHKLNRGETVIPELSSYRNAFVLIQDKLELRMIRKGNTSASHFNEDFYYISNAGKLIGDKMTNFKNITDITIKPSGKKLTVEGGIFKFNGEKPVITSIYPHVRIERSNVDIIDVVTQMDDGVLDTQSSYYLTGFFYVVNCANVKFNDVNILPRNINNQYSSYGIGGQHVINLTFDGIIANSDRDSWGVVGMNLIKDLKVYRSDINRLDVHYMVWNLLVKDSTIGDKGLRVTGGGDLIIDNVKVKDAMTFVDFRTDYGAFWDGKISIKRCKLKPKNDNLSIRLLDFRPDPGHDYQTKLTFGTSIFVEDFEFDMSDYDYATQPRLIDLTDGTFPDNTIEFPSTITFKDIKVKGIENRGITVGDFKRNNEYILKNKGEVNSYHIKTNATITIDNVDMSGETNQLVDTWGASVRGGNNTYINDYSLYPHFVLKNLRGVTIKTESAPAEITIENSLVHYLDFSPTNKAFLTINDSQLQLVKLGSLKSVIEPYIAARPVLKNVMLLPPIIDGQTVYTAFNEYVDMFGGTISADGITGTNIGNIVERKLALDSNVTDDIKQRFSFKVDQY